MFLCNVRQFGIMMILREISYKQFRPMLEDCFPEEQIDELVFINNIQNNQFLFASYKDQVRGYLLFDFKTKPARVIQLCVEKGYRNLGIGSYLINHLKEMLEDNNIPELILNVDTQNTNAIRFYEKHGFVKTNTNREYYCQLGEIREFGCTHLSIAPMEDANSVLHEFQLGKYLTECLVNSPSNDFYSVLNESGQSIGHFSFDTSQSEISLCSLNNPQQVSELLVHFGELRPSPDLWINSVDDIMDNYIEKIPGITAVYKLQVMKYITTTKDLEVIP